MNNNNSTIGWLSELYEQTELHLKKAIVVYQNLTEEQLLRKPSNGGWSVAECLEHLNTYGRYYIPAVNQAIRAATDMNKQPYPTFKSGVLGKYFIQLMKNTKGRKLKAFGTHIPSAYLKGFEVVGTFIHQQEQWLHIFKDAEQLNLSKVKVPISISWFIRLKLGDTLAFVKAHDERHIQQADRVLGP